MEYRRTDDAQIQADFAGRVGQILMQYESLKTKLPIEEQYEATLSIALLQTMLTQCQELLKNNRSVKNAPLGLEELVAMANRGFDEPPPLLGITHECILDRWPSERSLKYRDVIECIRNALSHPLPQTNERLPRTGYTSQKCNSGLLEAFVFTQSPWVGPSGLLLSHYRVGKGEKYKFDDVSFKVKNWARNLSLIHI